MSKKPSSKSKVASKKKCRNASTESLVEDKLLKEEQRLKAILRETTQACRVHPGLSGWSRISHAHLQQYFHLLAREEYSIQEIHLKGRSFNHMDCTSLFHLLGNKQGLTRIKLEHCGLGDLDSVQFTKLMQFIVSNPCVHHLSIRGRDLGKEKLCSLFSLVQTCKTLESLTLVGSIFATAEVGESAMACLQRNQSLKSVSFDDRHRASNNSMVVPKNLSLALRENHTLESLEWRFRAHEVPVEIIQCLADCFEQGQCNLRTLKLISKQSGSDSDADKESENEDDEDSNLEGEDDDKSDGKDRVSNSSNKQTTSNAERQSALRRLYQNAFMKTETRPHPPLKLLALEGVQIDASSTTTESVVELYHHQGTTSHPQTASLVGLCALCFEQDVFRIPFHRETTKKIFDRGEDADAQGLVSHSMCVSCFTANQVCSTGGRKTKCPFCRKTERWHEEKTDVLQFFQKCKKQTEFCQTILGCQREQCRQLLKEIEFAESAFRASAELEELHKKLKGRQDFDRILRHIIKTKTGQTGLPYLWLAKPHSSGPTGSSVDNLLPQQTRDPSCDDRGLFYECRDLSGRLSIDAVHLLLIMVMREMNGRQSVFVSWEMGAVYMVNPEINTETLVDPEERLLFNALYSRGETKVDSLALPPLHWSRFLHHNDDHVLYWILSPNPSHYLPFGGKRKGWPPRSTGENTSNPFHFDDPRVKKIPKMIPPSDQNKFNQCVLSYAKKNPLFLSSVHELYQTICEAPRTIELEICGRSFSIDFRHAISVERLTELDTAISRQNPCSLGNRNELDDGDEVAESIEMDSDSDMDVSSLW